MNKDKKTIELTKQIEELKAENIQLKKDKEAAKKLGEILQEGVLTEASVDNYISLPSSFIAEEVVNRSSAEAQDFIYKVEEQEELLPTLITSSDQSFNAQDTTNEIDRQLSQMLESISNSQIRMDKDFEEIESFNRDIDLMLESL